MLFIGVHLRPRSILSINRTYDSRHAPVTNYDWTGESACLHQNGKNFRNGRRLQILHIVPFNTGCRAVLVSRELPFFLSRRKRNKMTCMGPKSQQIVPAWP